MLEVGIREGVHAPAGGHHVDLLRLELVLHRKTNTRSPCSSRACPGAATKLRVDVLECGATVVEASRGPADDADLNNQCFEP